MDGDKKTWLCGGNPGPDQEKLDIIDAQQTCFNMFQLRRQMER